MVKGLKGDQLGQRRSRARLRRQQGDHQRRQVAGPGREQDASASRTTRRGVDLDEQRHRAPSATCSGTTPATLRRTSSQRPDRCSARGGGIDLGGLGGGGGGGVRCGWQVDDAGFFRNKLQELAKEAPRGTRPPHQAVPRTAPSAAPRWPVWLGGLSAAAQGIFAIGANAAAALPALAVLTNGLIGLGQVGARPRPLDAGCRRRDRGRVQPRPPPGRRQPTGQPRASVTRSRRW